MKKTPSSLESADEILSLLKRNVHERETEGEDNASGSMTHVSFGFS